MMHWVLDDGPLGLLARMVTPGDTWPAGRLHVSEDVAANAQRDRSGRRQPWLAARRGSGPSVVVHAIVTGTDVGKMVYEHLRTNAADASTDLGEDESIALCALDLVDAVFVSMDKGASYKALVELGLGRVASPFDLWLELRAEGLITETEFAKLCDATAKGDSGIAGVPARITATP
jgi:hypothetical protein